MAVHQQPPEIVMMQRSFVSNAARGFLTAGTALSLGFGAYAQDEPPTLPVAEPQPEVMDNADPDNFFGETGDRGRKYQPFNPFLDVCEADRCLAVTMSQEAAGSNFLGWMTDKAVEHMMVGATMDYVDWIHDTGNNPFLVTAVYENGVLVSSNETAMDYPWLDEAPDAQAPSDKPDWSFAPISGPFVREMLSSAAAADNPDATSSPNPPATTIPEPDNWTFGGMGDRPDGLGYPNGTTAVELDPSAFGGGMPPMSLSDAVLASNDDYVGPNPVESPNPVDTPNPVDSPLAEKAPFIGGGSVPFDGRIGLIALAPQDIGQEAEIQSFGLLIQLED